MTRPETVERAADILDFVRSFTAEHGFAPTTTQIGLEVGLASRSSVHRYLCSLRDAGILEWSPGATRTMRIVNADR